MSAPLLVFGWGNRSRGDDALGPLLVERLAAEAPVGVVECLEDHQLQPEHALDLVGREYVLFVDASVEAPAPFQVTPLVPARDASFTTHALSPAALLQVFVQVHRAAPPPCTLLAIRGQAFELGAPLSAAARANLDAAQAWARKWVATKAKARVAAGLAGESGGASGI